MRPTRVTWARKRKRLVEQYRYNTKNAAHLIRLLRIGIEFLRDGELIVDRGGYDAQDLLAVKVCSENQPEIPSTLGIRRNDCSEAHR